MSLQTYHGGCHCGAVRFECEIDLAAGTRVMDPEKKMPHWSEFERGGHFGAMEEPELLVGDIRKFFRTLR